MSNIERIVLIICVLCIWIVFSIAYIKHRQIDKDIEYITRHQVHVQQQLSDIKLSIIETDKSIVRQWRWYASKVKEAPSMDERQRVIVQILTNNSTTTK